MSDTEIPLYARINGAQAWKPEKDRTTDAMLAGVVVAIQKRTSDYGDYPVVVVDDGGDRLRAFHAFHKVAREALTQLKPSAGESIAIIAHPVTAANKRVDAQGNPTLYTPYTIYNPDAEVTVTSDWTWDDAETEPDF